ncbi:MAG: hypothetical protein ACFCUI_09330 [Bernardetiaceae bacterium]
MLSLDLERVVLPLLFPDWVADVSSESYLASLPEEPPPYLILLIRAGAAAMGYFVYGEPALHKTITTYMVRKQQGKSQLKHLHQKGKSRLGSRIRLRNTISFFENINTKLNDWEEIDETDKIFYSSSINHWYLLHHARVPCPFAAQDTRLCPVPLDIDTPNFEELCRVNDFLSQTQIFYEH